MSENPRGVCKLEKINTDNNNKKENLGGETRKQQEKHI